MSKKPKAFVNQKNASLMPEDKYIAYLELSKVLNVSNFEKKKKNVSFKKFEILIVSSIFA